MRTSLFTLLTLSALTPPAAAQAGNYTCWAPVDEWEAFTECVQEKIVEKPLPYRCDVWLDVMVHDPEDTAYVARCHTGPLPPWIFDVEVCNTTFWGWEWYWACVKVMIDPLPEGGATCALYTLEDGPGVAVCRRDGVPG